MLNDLWVSLEMIKLINKIFADVQHSRSKKHFNSKKKKIRVFISIQTHYLH